MNEAPKKLTRVSFVGVSNLPPQKAAELGAALQRIVSATAEVHNACDDTRIDVDSTFKRLGTLVELRDVVARVAVLAGEEVALGAPTLHAELSTLADTVAQQADYLRQAFTQYDEHHPQRGAFAIGIFRSLLHLAQGTIDLLRASDRGACTKLAALVSTARAAAQEVHDANSIEALQQATHNIQETSVMISKRFHRRAELFDDPEFERKVTKATTAAELATSALINTKQTILLSGGGVPVVMDDILNAFNLLDEIALCSPEFSVIMEVEYFEDKTSLDIAALLEACMKRDAGLVVRHTRDLASNIHALVEEGRRAALSLASPEKEKVLQACDDANAAMMDLVQTSKEILATQSPATRTQLAQQQANAAQRLRKAVSAIPAHAHQPLVLVRDRRRLAEAARGLMEDFTSLIVPLSTPAPSLPLQ